MHACVLEVVVHSASHSVCLKSQVHILAVSMVDVILVQDIVQTLIEVLQVEEDNCTTSLHANLDLVDISTDLHSTVFPRIVAGASISKLIFLDQAFI